MCSVMMEGREEEEIILSPEEQTQLPSKLKQFGGAFPSHQHLCLGIYRPFKLTLYQTWKVCSRKYDVLVTFVYLQ